MKRILAAVGTVAIGSAGAVATATPAHAGSAEMCDPGQTANVDPLTQPGDDWYMECVPYFGATGGKDEELYYVLEQTDPFPAEFTAGFNPSSATITGGSDVLANQHLSPTVRGGSADSWLRNALAQPNTFGLSTRRPVFQIHGASAVPVDDLPAACAAFGSYDTAFRVDYAPHTLTVEQTINGETYRFARTAALPPLFVAFTLDPTSTHAPIDATAPLCVGTEWHLTGASGPGTAWSSALGRIWSLSYGAAGLIYPPEFTVLPRVAEVRYDSDGGTPVDAATVRWGSAAGEPAAPTRSGYVFAGWFTAAADGAPWDFATPVDQDITLYAHWSAAEAGLAVTGSEPDPRLWVGGAGALLIGVGLLVARRRRRAQP